MKHHKCGKLILKSELIYPFTMTFLLIAILLIGCNSNPYKLWTDETGSTSIGWYNIKSSSLQL